MLQLVRLVKGEQGQQGMVHPRHHPTGLAAHNVADLFDNLNYYLTLLGPDDLVNVFWTISHHGGLQRHLPSRTAQTFEYQTVIPFDIDHCQTNRAMEYVEAFAHVCSLSTKDLLVVNSGNGVQIFVNLKTPIRSAKFFREMKPAYNEICRKIDSELLKRGLPGDADRRVFDAARVMRLPGTLNRKPKLPDKDTALIQKAYTFLDFDLMQVSGLDVLKLENVTPEEIRRQYPKPDFTEVVKECHYVKWAMEQPSEVHEPHLFDLISLLAPMPPGAKIPYQGQDMAAYEVANYIFDHATASQSLARGVFKDKWEAASRYGARKCSTIASNWEKGCEGCPHRSKIPTPLALKSPDHIGSEELGFWVRNSKGGFVEPNYGDVVKLYTREVSPVVRSGGIFSVFNGTHYQEEMELRAEAWLEKKVVPSGPLKTHHCKEFMNKIKRAVVLSHTSDEEYFTRSLFGKLNCQNGVLDILNGTLLPHSPQFGFQNVLPYEYLPDESSELFIDWLGTITENRPELMDAILDVMAYNLWPTYDDHIFTFLIGGGANGKSTLIHIMEEMVGKGNYSTASIQQLGANRFAPANLVGKMVNFSEESSGYKLSSEEIGIIKDLSSGGTIQAERKGVQGFEFSNRAKLIFSANKTPQFMETGHSIQRRMLTIPFDHTIKNPDSQIEKNLISEVPKIISMLVRRIQENIRENGGKFKVFRGGEVAAEMQRRVLLAGNTVVSWATEVLEVSPDLPDEQYVSTSDAYMHYRKWCAENGYDHPKPANSFSHELFEHVIPKSVDKNKNVLWVKGKAVRVFKKTKWKEEHI